MLPESYLSGDNRKLIKHEALKIFLGFYYSIASLAKAGNNVIVDTVLEDGIEDFKELIPILIDYNVMFVGLHCPLEELERREIARCDRQKGLAEYQFDRVHSHGVYDLEIDSHDNTSEQCASMIKEYFYKNEKRDAFKRIKDKFNIA